MYKHSRGYSFYILRLFTYTLSPFHFTLHLSNQLCYSYCISTSTRPLFFVLLTIVYIYYLGSLQINHSCPFHPLHLPLMNSYDIIIRTPSYAIPSYMSRHILNYAMACHHIFNIIIHGMSSLPLSFL